MEIQRAHLDITLAIHTALGDIEQAMLEADKELPLAPQLNAHVIVKTKIETFVTVTKQVTLHLRSISLDYVFTQNTETEIRT